MECPESSLGWHWCPVDIFRVVGGLRVKLKGIQEYIEIAFDQRGWRVVSGPPDGVRELTGRQ